MILTHDDNDITHRALIVGLSGSGKSTLVAELATAGFRLHWLDLENSKDVLTKLPATALANINYIRIPDSAAFPVAADTLMRLLKGNGGHICSTHGKFDCALCKKGAKPFEKLLFNEFDVSKDILVIDSITQLAASILAHVCKDKPVDYKPERDDWGGLRKFSEYFASQFQAFPYNLVCTAHAIEAEMEDGRTKLVPAFGSKDMSSKIAKAFSDVIYMETKNRAHVAYSSSTASNMVLTKSRSDFVIESLATPSLVPLFSGVKQVPPTQGSTALASLRAGIKVAAK